MKQLILILLFFYISIEWCQAQEFAIFSEPIIKVSTEVSSNYSMDFGIENRNVLFEDHDFKYIVKHVQFTHFSNFKVGTKKQLGFGLQYRFQKNFNASKENEVRLQQQYKFRQQRFEHRFRTEQRIHKSYTNYRFRYQLKYRIPFDKSSESLDIATEGLLQIREIENPELEHRFSVTYNLNIDKAINMEIGPQYRLSDYSNELAHEIFMITTVSIEL